MAATKTPGATTAAREAARNRSNGQFGEQQLADPGVELLAVPEPPQRYLDLIWDSLSREKKTNGVRPTTLADLRRLIGEDLPGLPAEQQDWFTNRVLEFADSWLRCREVLDLPGGASWPAINARIPKGLQQQIPRKDFRVRDDSNVEHDPDSGRPTGRTFTRYGNNDEWVQALADHCAKEITGLVKRARAASDKVSPRRRSTFITDPWVGYNDNPPF